MSLAFPLVLALALETSAPERAARALVYARILQPSFNHRIAAVIEPREAMPANDIIAHTTVPVPPRSGCLLHFTPNVLSTRMEEAIAHETCHCVLDYGMLGSAGYEPHLEQTKLEELEVGADRCAKDLLSRRAIP